MTNDYFVKRLNELLEQEEKNHGLLGFHVFPSANKDISLNDLARESVRMHEDFLAGYYTDITNNEL